MAQPVSEEKVLELLGVMPMSRRELAREFGVPWQDGTLHNALMTLFRRHAIEADGEGYPERWRVAKGDG